MATFSEVKSILDALASTHAMSDLQNAHGGNSFGWETAEALRNAVARFPGGEEYPFMAAHLIGNGRADETYLIRVLSGPLADEDIPQMPRWEQPRYATPEEIETIRDWINEGALPDADCD